MNIKIQIITILFFCFGMTKAQDIQWAFKVLEYSSQKESKAFSAKQALGKPNVLPNNGERISAWQTQGTRKEEYIKLGFLSPMMPKQIVIAESFHPGYVHKIFFYDASGTEYELASFKPKPTTLSGRVLTVNTSEVNFYVFAIKVVLKPKKGVPVGIDAIGITESTLPVSLKLNQAEIIKSNMQVTKLGKSVNSIYQEYGPLLSPDGQTLYLSRRSDPRNVGGEKDLEDIWYSDWDSKNQKWGEAKNMGAPLNNKDPNFINSVSPDGNTILLGNSYLADGTMDGGASLSYRTASGWTFPKRVVIEDEENISNKANFYLSNSQKVLLMSVERKKDTQGGRDIYASFLKPDSSWTKPLNLGPTVNSVATEAAPFLAADERTLYFTSDGFAGYGGSDIYVTRRLDDTWKKWSAPENLGPIVNTPFDESYFTLSAYGDKMYYTSQAEGLGDIDMYTLVLPNIVRPLPVMFVKGRVLDSKTNLPLTSVKIMFENLSTGIEVGIAKSNPITGEYGIILPVGSKYGYLAESKGYISVSANIDLQVLTEYTEMRKNLYLTPIETGQSIVLNNIFFDFDKSELGKESHLELNRLAKLMTDNPRLRIEVSGHTDNIGLEAYNDQLSFERASAVVAYLLTQKSVGAERIATEHYGSKNPVANNATAWGRQLNRRVQFRILSK
jgi:OmpA-OmpF porin, OOP family